MNTSSKNGTDSSTEEDVRAVDLKITRHSLIAYLDDGRVIEVPLEWYPRLADAPAEKLRNFKWIGRGLGITWPELDEDLSIEGFLRGNRAQRSAAYMDFAWRRDRVAQPKPGNSTKGAHQKEQPALTAPGRRVATPSK